MTDTPQASSYLAWFKAHERLIIIILAASLVYHIYGSAVNTWIDHDKRSLTAQTQIAQLAQQKTVEDQQQNQQLLQQLSDLKVQYASLSGQLKLAEAQREQQTTQQKQKNDQSDTAQIAVRIAQLLRVQPQELTYTDVDGSLTMSPAAAHSDVNALEDATAALAEVGDLNKQVAACAAVSQKQDTTIAGLQGQLRDEQTSHAADLKKDQDQIQLAKDEGKKKFRSGLKWGSAVTAIVIGVIKLAAIIH